MFLILSMLVVTHTDILNKHMAIKYVSCTTPTYLKVDHMAGALGLWVSHVASSTLGHQHTCMKNIDQCGQCS
jgi:hypothetical protein